MNYGPSVPTGPIPIPMMASVGGPGIVESNYFMPHVQQQEFLFPPPTMQPPQQYEVPRGKHNSGYVTQQMEDMTIHNPTPPTTTTATPSTTAAEDIANIDWKELTDDTTRKTRKSKHRSSKSTTQASSNNFSTSPLSASESSSGKSGIKGISTRRGGRGRARSRDMSSAHGSKQKHQLR